MEIKKLGNSIHFFISSKNIVNYEFSLIGLCKYIK